MPIVFARHSKLYAHRFSVILDGIVEYANFSFLIIKITIFIILLSNLMIFLLPVYVHADTQAEKTIQRLWISPWGFDWNVTVSSTPLPDSINKEVYRFMGRYEKLSPLGPDRISVGDIGIKGRIYADSQTIVGELLLKTEIRDDDESIFSKRLKSCHPKEYWRPFFGEITPDKKGIIIQWCGYTINERTCAADSVYRDRELYHKYGCGVNRGPLTEIIMR